MTNKNDTAKTVIRYSLELHSPLGIKNGVLILNDENKLTGRLNILNTECSTDSITVNGDNLEFHCVIKTLIGEITCDVHLTDKRGSIYGMVQTNKGCMAITGQRLNV